MFDFFGFISKINRRPLSFQAASSDTIIDAYFFSFPEQIVRMGFTHPGNPLPLLCLWLLLFRSTHARFFTQGTQGPGYLQKAEITVRSKIGSRPPLCERRCTTCSHCEPVQVPAVPQAHAGRLAAGLVFRGDDGSSNYKPVSWKCKCGNLILNP